MMYSHTKSDKIDISDFPSHMHNGYELLYFLEGDCDYSIEGSVYELKKYDLVIIKPRTFHNLLPRSFGFYERIVINFDEQEVEENINDILSHIPPVFSTEGLDYIRGFYKFLTDKDDLMDARDLDRFVLSSLNEIFISLKYESPKKVAKEAGKNSEKTRLLLEKIVEYIDRHPTENLNVDNIADRFYLSRSWLSHMFSRTFGVGPGQYIMRKRILYSQKLLSEGRSPTETAEICGFGNYSTFYRQYLKTFGTYPKASALK